MQDYQTAMRRLIEFAAQNGFTVTPGATTRGVTDQFEDEMKFRRLPGGDLYWAWFRSVTDPDCSFAICFKPGQGKVVSYGNKYGNS